MEPFQTAQQPYISTHPAGAGRGDTQIANKLDRAEQLQQQVLKFGDQGNYREALPLLHQVITLTESVQRGADQSLLDWDNPESATIETIEEYRALSERCRTLRKNVGERLEQIRLLLEQRPESTDLVECLHSLAELYRTEHQYAKALPLYQRTLATWEQVLAPEHPDIVQSLTHVAYLLRTQDRHAEAQPLLERVLPIQEKQLGPEHPEVAETLSSLASVYSRRGEQAKAVAFYERALAIAGTCPWAR